MRLSYCLFMDILGFSDEMKNAYKEGRGQEHFEEFSEFFSDIIQQMERKRHGIFSERSKGEKDNSNRIAYWAQKVFTDNIVLGVPMRSGETEIEFGFIVPTIKQFQLKFALNGYFVRGGLDYGDLAMDDNIVFGLPLIESHRLECSVAKYPRIVFSDTVNRFIEKHIGYYSMNWKDQFPKGAPQYYDILVSEGERFINYLDELIFDGSNNTIIDWDELIHHKSLINERLSKHAGEEKILKKYQWLASYHNAFCKGISHHPEYPSNCEVNVPSTYTITGLDGKPWVRELRELFAYI